jgi:hypothetical protein
MKRTTRTDWGKHPLALALALVTLGLAAPLAGLAKPRERTAEEITPKPTPPIAITHRLSGSPQVGQPIEVVFSIAAEGDMTGVNVDFTAEDPIAMIDPVGSLGLGNLRAGQGTDVTVTVLPLMNQTHYLNVTVTALIDGTPQTRSIAVPIRLPGSEIRKSDKEAAGNPEESVRSFQAIETVH